MHNTTDGLAIGWGDEYLPNFGSLFGLSSSSPMGVASTIGELFGLGEKCMRLGGVFSKGHVVIVFGCKGCRKPEEGSFRKPFLLACLIIPSLPGMRDSNGSITIFYLPHYPANPIPPAHLSPKPLSAPPPKSGFPSPSRKERSV